MHINCITPIDIQADLNNFTKLIRNPPNEGFDPESYKYSNPFLFSNENCSYINNINYSKNFSALCISGALDQCLDLVLKGANEVYCIDINNFQYYIAYLKILAIKSLDYYQFIQLLINPYSGFYFDHKLITSLVVSDSSKDLANIFWKNLLQRFNSFDIRRCLIDDFLINTSDLKHLKFNYISSERNYNCLKQNLETAKIYFSNCDIRNFKTSSFKFDIIHLSNICLFLEDNYNDFIKIINNLASLLNDNGKIISYYSRHVSSWFNYNCFENIPNTLIAPNIEPVFLEKNYLEKFSQLYSVMSLINDSLKVYHTLRNARFGVSIHEIPTGGSMSCLFNTPVDSVMVIQK